MMLAVAVALLSRMTPVGSSALEPLEHGGTPRRPSRKAAGEDLVRARQYGDQLKTFMAASNTGAIGILLATAGSLAGKDVSPNWITIPVVIFAANLVIFAGSLLMGEHRSILRRRDKDAQSKLPFWKMGITWNCLILGIFVAGVIASVIALRGICIPRAAASAVPTVTAEPKDACDRAYWDWNNSAALMRCKIAAEAGGADSEFGYGLVLWSGPPGSVNRSASLDWFRESARQGHWLAQTFLGGVLQHPELDASLRNRPEAYAWLVTARATKSAAELRTKMSKDEISEGDRLAAEFSTKYPVKIPNQDKR